MSTSDAPNLDTRRETIAALCLAGGAQGKSLFAFASAADENLLGRVDSTPLSMSPGKSPHLDLPWEEIHPGWLVDHLEGESPQILGIVCRILPGDRVRYLIDHLPAATRRLLPKLQSSYEVSQDVVDVVKEILTKRIAFPRIPKGPFSLPHLLGMKGEDLRLLFWSLGIDEIAAAFHDVEPKILKAFIARFSVSMAREIRDRVEKIVVSAERKQDAQRHLVSLNLDQLSSEELVRHVGYSVFGRALIVQDLVWAEKVPEKLIPAEGYHLKRILKETATVSGDSGRIQGRKDAILCTIEKLADRGTIRRYWKATTGSQQ